VIFNRTANEFGSTGEVHDEGKSGQVPVFAGGSADFKDLLFEANDDLLSADNPLRPELDAKVKAEIADGEDNDYLYESDLNSGSGAPSVNLVSILPNGEIAPNATFGAPATGNPERNPPDFDGAVSGPG